MKVVLSPEARDDLAAIGDFIAQESPRRAESFVRELVTACRSIGRGPMAHRRVTRRDGQEIRRKVHKAYLIFYRSSPAVIEIIRIVQGSQDASRLNLSDES